MFEPTSDPAAAQPEPEDPEAKATKERLRDIWISFRSRSKIGQLWLAVLYLSQLVSWGCIWDPVGYSILSLFVVILIVNGIILWHYRGFTRLIHFIHLLLWNPLCIYLILRLSGKAGRVIPNGDPTQMIATVCLLFYCASLCFDIRNTFQWFAGDHAVCGTSDWGRWAQGPKEDPSEPVSPPQQKKSVPEDIPIQEVHAS